MKKLSLFLLLLFLLQAAMIMPVEAKPKPEAGSLIKGKGLSTVYYLAEDGKRYVFPNEKAFFSWYDDFSTVHEISMDELQTYPLSGNVRYKPGAVMIKIQTDPKVYAVGANGELRWVKNEALARAFYGQYWNKMIDDVPDSFFTNYRIAAAVETDDDYDPEGEQEQAPTISHNRGFKPLKQIQAKDRQEKMCGRLEGALNRLQVRLMRFGIELTDLGDEVLEKCYGLALGDQIGLGTKKVTLCHKGETITVGAPAARVHLRHGDHLGPCKSESAAPPDTAAPVISNVAAAPAVNSAVVTWTTNEAADSLVRYATSTLSTASVIKSVSASAKVTSHSLNLSGLEADTIYYYAVTSKDAAGNTATSSQKTFKTLPSTDTTAPEISNVAAAPAVNSAVVTWTTNEAADSLVRYATSTLSTASVIKSVSASAKVTSHSLNLSGLEADTTYYYAVTSKDAAGNTATSSQKSFKTLPATDTTAPVISDVTKTIGATTATIAWTTDEPATSLVRYATSTLAAAWQVIEVSDANLKIGHSIALSGLATSTEYYFKISSSDEANNTATTAEDNFTTLAE